MKPEALSMAGEILPRCKTLAEADAGLLKLRPIPTTAMRWGLWDGFSGRPKSYAGLAAESIEVPRKIAEDYAEGLELGRRLALEEA